MALLLEIIKDDTLKSSPNMLNHVYVITKSSPYWMTL